MGTWTTCPHCRGGVELFGSQIRCRHCDLMIYAEPIPQLAVHVAYYDGSTPGRSEDPVETGWHYIIREFDLERQKWRSGGPSHKTYRTEDQARVAGNAYKMRHTMAPQEECNDG